jgi:hypothetical protein
VPMNSASPVKSGRALLCQTRCVTHPQPVDLAAQLSANLEIRPILLGDPVQPGAQLSSGLFERS